jgi:hypothetical protein
VGIASQILVGRKRELDLLDQIMQQALAGRGGSAWIVGEPGIGKTRSLLEMAERATARGFAVAWGRGWEPGNAPSYWPWLEILRTLLARSAAPRDHERVDPLDLLSKASSETAAPSRGTDVFLVYDAVRRYLRAHSNVEPLALFFDDLHATDAASLELAEFVVAGLSDHRIAVFASQCDVISRGRPNLELRLSRLARRSERVTLSRLSREHVTDWVLQATSNPDAGIARRIYEASDGNPLFVSELLRLLLFERPLSAGELPATLRALIHERFEVLGARQVELLRAAALVGRTFALTLWADVADAPRGVVARAAHQGWKAGLLSPAERGHYRFSHALVAETLVLELGPVERAALHRRAAQALERRHENDPAAPLDEIARHWLEAGVEAAPLASTAAERAARQAMSRFDFADAAHLYERAIEAQLSILPVDARRLAELHVALVEALARSEQRASAELACARAAELARALADGQLLARAALALGGEARAGHVNLPVLNLLEQALAWLPDEDTALGALVRARLASEQQTSFNPGPPLQLAREAIAMARRLGDERLLLSVTQTSLCALMELAPAEERSTLNREAVELALRLRDRAGAFRALERLAFDRLELADLNGFEDALVHCEMLAAATHEPCHAWVPLMFRSMRAEWQGEFAHAERLEREARAACEEGHGEGALLVPGRAVARVLVRADQVLLEPIAEDFQSQLPESLSSRLLAGLLAAWQGRGDDARQALDALATDGLARLAVRGAGGPLNGDASNGVTSRSEYASRNGSSVFNPHFAASASFGFDHACMLEVSVEIVWYLADVVWADRLYRALEPRAGQALLLTVSGFYLYGVVDHALSRLSAVLGRWCDFERHAHAAIDWSRRMRAQPLRARICRDVAAIQLGRARASVGAERCELATRALELAKDGERIAMSLGMDAIAEHCRGLITEHERRRAMDAVLTTRSVNDRHLLQALPAEIEHEAHVLQLTREGEYWTIRLAGELCRVQHGRGIQMLAQLASSPGREIHVLELSGLTPGVEVAGGGSMLDPRARAAYRQRLSELRSEMDEASSFNDLARRERLQEEVDALTRELARAFGLGGRARRSGSLVERARVNVRRRLTLALRRIRAASPSVGEAIAGSLRTGVHCVYRPKN